MGCETSRPDSKNDNDLLDDLNCVQLSFTCGSQQGFDGCPVDKFMISRDGEIDEQYRTDGLKACDQKTIEKIYQATQKALQNAIKELKEKKKIQQSDLKESLVGRKYKLSDAIGQLKGVLAELQERSTIQIADNVNFETSSMAGVLAPAEDNDSYDYAGWENLPALYLKLATQFPIFNDMIKAQVIATEFNLRGLQSPDNFGKDFIIAAGLLCATVYKAPKEKNDVWFSGLVEDDAYAALKEMAIGQKPLLFPGVLVGYENKEEAARHFDALEYHGTTNPHRVMFMASEVLSFKFVGKRFFAHRLAGYIYASHQDDKIHTFKLASAPKADISTIEAWEESFEPNVW